MKLKLNQKGFSMMELLIALTVLALTAVPVYSMMVVAAQYVGENDMRADCLRLAENEMERLKANFDPEFAAENSDPYYTFETIDPEATEPPITQAPEQAPGETEALETEPNRYEPYRTYVGYYRIGGSNCYSVTVTVSKGDYSVTLKGVCVYEAAS